MSLTCYDDDILCLNNICQGKYGFSLGTKTVTFFDTPYDAQLTDVIIFADADLGDLTINLPAVTTLCNQLYMIKKIDSSTSTVTILPAAGQTIDGGASYVLSRPSEVSYFVLDGTEWKVINNRTDRILTTKGDLLTSNGVFAERLPVGADGLFLQADSSTTTGLRWTTLGSASITYQLVHKREIATSWMSYADVAYFPWDDSRYSSYTMGTIIFYATVTPPITLNVRFRDITNAVTLGSSLAIAASGIITFSVINPTSNAYCALQIQKSGPGPTSPVIFGVNLEYTA